jgi:hypothetical protein
VKEPKQKDCFNVKEREERRGNGMIAQGMRKQCGRKHAMI